MKKQIFILSLRRNEGPDAISKIKIASSAFSFLAMTSLFLCISLTHSSCGKKQAPAVSESSSAGTTALPELAQNKMYLTNHPVVSGPQDASFEPVSNEMQSPSQNDLEAAPPPTD